ncbi:hypothetical protein GCM10025870_32470 [Agromyces marinus]|uniref:Uncharacterized protein n=1 Tax=Agromyces marinus TaxID=1389020 RepID=A0ABM8H5S1_9MICO|nr:hypothetical protein GCM10025870_32470 [Agromyces marinus]
MPETGPRAGLHLDEHEGGAVAQHEVELTVSAAPVPVEHAHAAGLEVIGRELFASPTEVDVVCHAHRLPGDRAPGSAHHGIRSRDGDPLPC